MNTYEQIDQWSFLFIMMFIEHKCTIYVIDRVPFFMCWFVQNEHCLLCIMTMFISFIAQYNEQKRTPMNIVHFCSFGSFLFNDCHFCSITVILNKMTSLNKNDICSVKSFLFNMFKFLFIFGHFCSKWPMNKCHFVYFWCP